MWHVRIFTSVKIHIIDLLVVKICRLIGGCKRFEEIYCLPLQGVMKENTTVWNSRQTISYVTSIYIIILRSDNIVFGCSVFIFRSEERKSISYKRFWEFILTSNQGFIPAKFCCTWPVSLPNDGPLLRVINIGLPHCTQFMHNMSYVKPVCFSVFVFTNANQLPKSM